jgi:hemerythrin
MHLQYIEPPALPDSVASLEDRAWDSRYRSIVGELDRLIELLGWRPEQPVHGHLERLLRVVSEHLSCENDSMQLVGYPEAQRHRLMHQSLCLSTAVLCQHLNRNRFLLDELIDLRLRWLEHIEVHDRAFEDFLAC